MMNIQDLARCYYIQQEDILRLERLGLLDNIPVIDGQKRFNDDNVRQIMKMIYLMQLGLDDQNLVSYWNNEEMQVSFLKKIRVSILEQLHLYQKKLDDIDYIIYEKEKIHQKEEEQ